VLDAPARERRVGLGPAANHDEVLQLAAGMAMAMSRCRNTTRWSPCAGEWRLRGARSEIRKIARSILHHAREAAAHGEKELMLLQLSSAM
jgi:hypothetical protein